MLCLWTADAEQEFHRLSYPQRLYDMDMSSHGTRLVTAHWDHHVRLTELSPA